jgi:acid phosphatase (class B)
MLKEVRSKVEAGWTTTKKLLAALSVWGLIFSVVTISRFGVAFDYDDTLVFSTPAFSRAYANGGQPFSPQFWGIVNNSYELERPKIIGCGLAWIFRLFGFRISIVSARPPYEGEALAKEWRRLAPKGFVFAGDRSKKHVYLQNGRYLLFFGDSDSDISQARHAGVMGVRIKRSVKSSYKEDYHPGTLGELVIPLSEY